jgi:biotin carboxyl carrier protein
VQVGDRSHAVEIYADGRVSVDGIAATWGQSGDGRTLIRDEQGKQEVIVLAPGARPQEAGVSGQRVALRVQSAAEAALDEALGGAGGGSGEGVLKSPMPGRIVKILAKAGDEVESGTPVIIIEAMKMENELGAPSAGRIESIDVEEGQAVEAGAVLLSLEAEKVEQD